MPSLLLIVPALTLILTLAFTYARGPFWLGCNSDPSYLYLYSSLYLLDHIKPFFTDHPGVPLQVLGAMIIKIIHWNSSDIAQIVFKNPEFYLMVIHTILWIFYIGSLIILGKYAYQKTSNIHFALWVQAGTLLLMSIPSYSGSYPVFPIIANINSDTFMMTAANLLVLILIKIYFSPQKPTLALTLWLALGVAFALTIKITALPWIILGLLILPDLRSRSIYLTGLVLFWLILTIPIWVQFPKMFGWIIGLITKTGNHGSGGEGIINLPIYMNNLRWAIQQNIFFFILITVTFFLSLGKSRINSFLRILCLVVLLQFILVAKQVSTQYIAPAVGLSSLVLGLLYLKFEDSIPPRVSLSLLSAFILSNCIYLGVYQKDLLRQNHATYHFSRTIHDKYSDYSICSFYRSSSPLYALACWNNGRSPMPYSKLLKSLYPGYYFYDNFDHSFKDFMNQPVPFKELVRGKKGVLVYGSNYGESSFGPSMSVRTLESTQTEAVSEVVSYLNPQAKDLFVVSMMLKERGQCREALEYALSAVKLGLPADLTTYINELSNCAGTPKGN